MKLMSKNGFLVGFGLWFVFFFFAPSGLLCTDAPAARMASSAGAGVFTAPPRRGLRSELLCRRLLPRRSPAGEKPFGWVYFLFVKKKNQIKSNETNETSLIPPNFQSKAVQRAQVRVRFGRHRRVGGVSVGEEDHGPQRLSPASRMDKRRRREGDPLLPPMPRRYFGGEIRASPQHSAVPAGYGSGRGRREGV